MDKLAKFVFTASLAYNVCAVIAFKEATRQLLETEAKLKLVEENRDKWRRHASLLSEAIKETYDNGGSLRLSKEMMDKVDMYIMFRDNNLI